MAKADIAKSVAKSASKNASKNVSKGANLAKKNKDIEAKRLEQKVKSYNDNARKSATDNLPKSSNASNNDNGSKKNSQLKEKLQKKAGSVALQAMGVPKELSDKAMDFAQSEKGQQVMKKINKMQNPFMRGIINKAMDMASSKKNTEEESYSSDGTTVVNEKKVIEYGLICLLAMMPLMFCCLLTAGPMIFLNAVGIGQADESSSSDVETKIEEKGDEGLSEDKTDEDLAMINKYPETWFNYNYGSYNVTIKKKEYASLYTLDNSPNLLVDNSVREDTEVDLSELEDFYGANLLYDETSNMQTVYNFYYKLHDIYVRYAYKQKVELDLPLLMSTLMLQSKDMNVVFVSNTTELYDRTNIGTIEHSVLDYDHDWSNYTISYNNSAHDIEILAQHMVSQKEDGTYFIDYDKYDEFLKEFLEKKYFLDSESEYISDNKDNESNEDNNAEWRTWMQCDSRWRAYKLGSSSKNMCQIGCLVTSLSIQIARSGTTITTETINPGIASKKFSYTSGGLLYWDSIKNLSPNFSRKTILSLVGLNKSQVLNKLSNYQSNNYYMILHVSNKNRNSAHHFVALDYIDNSTGEIYIIDPLSTEKKKLYDHYKLYKVHIMEKKD